jgi:hypothetical protein
MKKIRLLQIAVYIAFAAFFIQNAAPDAYKGFIEGAGLSKGYKETPGTVTSLIPSVYINGASFTEFKNNQLKPNDNYSLENISINADLKVKQELSVKPLWLSFCIAILVFGILFLVLKTAWTVNNIIFNIYNGTMFRSEAVKLMREMGILLILYFIADYIFQQLSYLGSTFANIPFKLINPSAFNFEALILGLLVIAIADAFKEATQLKEQQEFTI